MIFSWSGFYVGGQLSCLQGGTHLTAEGESQRVAPPKDPKGLAGGLYAGYNAQAEENTVIGVETDWQWANLGKIINDVSGSHEDKESARLGLKQNWIGSTRLRLGYSLGRALPYVTAGLAYTKLKTPVSSGEGDRAKHDDSHELLLGWALGAGLDYAVRNNLMLRIEYRLNSFGTKKIGSDLLSAKIRYHTNDVRLGVAYKF